MNITNVIGMLAFAVLALASVITLWLCDVRHEACRDSSNDNSDDNSTRK